MPADGPLSAEDLRGSGSPLAFRGYRMAEVDALLERLAEERETVAREAADEEPAESPVSGERTAD